MWFLILIGLLSVFIYFKVIKPLKYWEEKGIEPNKHLKPWPAIGNMGPFLFKKRSFAHLIQDIYNATPEQRYVCFHQFLRPTIMFRDPDLIKQVTVKDFDAFPEHQTFVPEGVDSLWDKNLFAMKGGDKWHDMRTTLSPSFTSSKMRMMFDLMKACSKQLTTYFLKHDGTVEVEMKDVFSRFANDVIGTTAFGVTCDSLQNQRNEFYIMGKDLTDFSGIRGLLFFAYTISPSIMKLLKLRAIKKGVSTFFRNIISEAIKVREEKGIVRPDMIHLLMEAKKGRLKQEDQSNVVDSGFAVVKESELGISQQRQKAEITNEDIIAQAIVFFLAGFDTVSTLMSYVSYELAVNSDIQEKLREEVAETLECCKGDVTYEALLGMKYLDMIVSETLRKWPPAEFTERQCVKDFTIETQLPSEKPLHLDVGTSCWIPIYAIHRDAQYYPNPDKFDPERFSDENKKNIKPFTLLPFGAGPRICIGSRFALLETKLIIFEILSKFEIVPVEKTQIPLVLGKGEVNMSPEKGIWLGLKPKNIST